MPDPIDLLSSAIVGVVPDAWLRKMARKRATTEDQPYLSQYFGETDNLPDQPLRPKSLTKFQDRPFKGLSDDNRRWLENFSFKASQPLSQTPQRVPHSVENLDQGLGRSTYSAALDEAGNPYMSVFDSWDFDEPGATGKGQGTFDSIARAIMKKLGKPYNVYERLPLEPGPKPGEWRVKKGG